MDDRMRIGFVAVEDAGDEGSWSGIPYNLLDALKKQDVSITLFSPLSQGFRYALMPFKIAARMAKKEI